MVLVFPPIFREAIIFSSLLTLLSIGLTLTYMTTRVPNFAHGSFATVGAYISLVAVRLMSVSPYLFLPIAFLVSGFVALLLYRAVLRPLMRRGASTILLMVATIAFDMLLIAALNIFADYLSRTYKITSRYFSLKAADIRVEGIPMVFYVAPLIAVGLILTLYLLLTKTKFGVAMRAAIENPSLAGVVGINIDLVYTISWILAGGLAGIAGLLMSLWFIGNPDLGTLILVSIFSASIVGGLLNIYGAILGGFLVGFAEVIVTSRLASVLGVWVVPFRPVIPLLIMVIALLTIPGGLSSIRWSSIAKLWRR
ncbi:MAG: branched-chain amino acid ABC transporter permease [Aigarchaeota archaeon]|nr:branched-chain amino acid ABC transporter permease [Candidatus Pelearchaeum maunauluense]